jgi:hypothetical protein
MLQISIVPNKDLIAYQSPSTQELLIEKALASTPSWGSEYVRPAFEGDEEAAFSLCVSLRDHDRARMTGLMYRAQVRPAAFQAMLTGALSQSHYYNSVLAEAGGRRSLVKWLRYAAYTLPENLPNMVTIYRGVRGCTSQQGAKGLSWSLDFDVAAWFAVVHRHWVSGQPLVVQAHVRCSDLLFYSNDREEQEVIPRTTPRKFSVIDDPPILAKAAERQIERARAPIANLAAA